MALREQGFDGDVHELAVGQLDDRRAFGRVHQLPVVGHGHFDLDGDIEFFHAVCSLG
ncbi:hypothetical protein D3C87_2086150 [compost metagenome]